MVTYTDGISTSPTVLESELHIVIYKSHAQQTWLQRDERWKTKGVTGFDTMYKLIDQRGARIHTNYESF